VVGIVAEVPTGALADRFSRRAALVAGSIGQALGYVAWTAWPSYGAFAAGFVLWGLGGSLTSGSLEALLFDNLALVGAQDHFARVYGRVTALGLVASVPTAAAATVLFSTGGYALVGWVSVACCLAAGVLATRLPEAPRAAPEDDDDEALGFFAELRAGVVEAARRPAVRTALVAAAVLASFDAFEEYFALLARDWGVPVALTPVAVLGIPLAGAAGAALGGSASRLGRWRLAALLAAAGAAMAVAGLLHAPVSLLATSLCYGAYRLVLVVVSARLQERIEGPARATVTSVAGLGTDLASICLYALWPLGGVLVVAALFAGMALWLPALLRVRVGSPATVAEGV
jgi:hypothetical protein